jgi:hypothetical protein
MSPHLNIIIMPSVINLVKTPLGYTLLEGDVEVNRTTPKTPRDKNYSMPKSTSKIKQNSHNKISPFTLIFREKKYKTRSILLCLRGRNGST